MNYYEEFLSLYETYQNNLSLGSPFQERLLDRYYKEKTYKRVGAAIKWFIENFDLSCHVLSFEFTKIQKTWLRVVNKKEGVLYIYYWKNQKAKLTDIFSLYNRARGDINENEKTVT